MAEIAGAKPTIVSECFAIGLRVSIVAGHDDVATDQNFADAVIVWPINFHFDAIQWFANRTNLVVFEASDRCGASCFSETVTLQQSETQPVIIERYTCIETRAGRNS